MPETYSLNESFLKILTNDYTSGRYQIFDIDDTFRYSLQQHAVNLTKRIFSIDTTFTLSVFGDDSTSTSKEYTLQPNETLQFYAPNLIDLRTYSNYVKYEYINTENPLASLPVNTDVKLGQYESLIVYWKTADDEDQHYQYAKFGAGAIIKPTFTVYVTATTYGSTLEVGQGVVIDDALNTHIAEDVTSILTGNRQISNRAINIVNLHSDFNYCYWVRNSKVKVGSTYKYELFNGTDTYMLQSGEYFIYTDNSFSSLNIVGAGTLLTRTRLAGQDTSPLYVDVIDYSDILSEGLNAISYDTWYSFRGSEMTIGLTEMQLINLSEGCTITFTRTDTSKWMLISLTNSGNAELSDFAITYTVPDDSEVYTLPAVVDDDIAWNVRGLLNLDLSPSRTQVLRGTSSTLSPDMALQVITLHYLTDLGVEATTTIPSNPQSAYAISLLASDDLYSSGLAEVNTTTLNEDGTTDYLSLYSYVSSTVTNSEHITFLEDQSIIFRFNDVTTSSTAPRIDFELPQLPSATNGVYSYILKVINPNTDCTIKLTTEVEGVSQDLEDRFGVTTLSSKGVYYYVLASASADDTVAYDNVTISIETKDGTAWDSITLDAVAMCKLKYSEYLSMQVTNPTADYTIGYEKALYINAVSEQLSSMSNFLRGRFALLFNEVDGAKFDPFDPLSYFNNANYMSRFVIPRLKDININIVNKD